MISSRRITQRCLYTGNLHFAGFPKASDRSPLRPVSTAVPTVRKHACSSGSATRATGCPTAARIVRLADRLPSMCHEVRAIEMAGDLDRLDDIDNGLQLGRDMVVEPNRDAIGLRLNRHDPSPERVLGRRLP